MRKSNPNNVLGSEPLIRPGLVANIPNALSLLRLLASPVLLVLALGEQGRPFRWLLVFCLLSDVADGLIARALRIKSRIGALLDSTADILVSAMAVFGVFTFQSQMVREHYSPVLVVIALYLLAAGGGVVRYGRLASFHTIACRIAAYAQGIFVVMLLFRGYEPTLFYLMTGVSVLAYIEEITLLWLLPTWSTDVGGLYWILRK
jgi:phosphatidylglycerophosphate synthase